MAPSSHLWYSSLHQPSLEGQVHHHKTHPIPCGHECVHPLQCSCTLTQVCQAAQEKTCLLCLGSRKNVALLHHCQIEQTGVRCCWNIQQPLMVYESLRP